MESKDMARHLSTFTSANVAPQPHAPFMVVNPGEDLLTAARRHRRDTGYYGALKVVAWNWRPSYGHRTQALAA